MNEAELVLTQVLNCDRLSLYLNKDVNLDRNKSAQISTILKRRIIGEPLQYILGTCEFFGFKFKIDRRALIPRPETEILVESAINELRLAAKTFPKILDLGTGSGCIAIAMAKLLPQSILWASDISSQALELAQENAKLNNVSVKFIQADLFGGFKNSSEKFDLIISNPPYIKESQLGNLAKEISFEPVQALEAGVDGLVFYRRIIDQAADYLEDGGLLAFEAGINQADPVSAMLLKENFRDIKIIKDYNNIKRVLIARNSKLETRNFKQTRNPKHETKTLPLEFRI